MKPTEAKTLTGGLSKTSKMPCASWSIPVASCQTGNRMMKVSGPSGEKSICSTCYANKGLYKKFQKSTLPAQTARLAAFDTLPTTVWVEAMVTLIAGEPHFRWFDAGDLQSVEMLHAICEVARATPKTRHWLPTRETAYVIRYLRDSATPANAIPPNLTIRISDMFIDRAAPLPASLREFPNITQSGVTKTEEQSVKSVKSVRCIAYTQNGKCGACRVCWDSAVARVTYPYH